MTVVTKLHPTLDCRSGQNQPSECSGPVTSTQYTPSRYRTQAPSPYVYSHPNVTALYPPIPEAESGRAGWDFFVSPLRVTGVKSAFPRSFPKHRHADCGSWCLMLFPSLFDFSSHLPSLTFCAVNRMKERKGETLFRVSYATLTFGTRESRGEADSPPACPFFPMIMVKIFGKYFIFSY